jgi:hypothetical protein
MSEIASDDMGSEILRTPAASWAVRPNVWTRPATWAWIVGVLTAVIYAVSMGEATPFDHYVLLADAFLHGRIELINPPPHLEVSVVGGHYYVIPPPGPALLVLPYVAVRGLMANQTLASCVVGGLGAGLGVLFASRLAPARRDYLWLGALQAFGTIMWFLSAHGSTWYFAHVVAVSALTLSMWETLGARRPIVIGFGIAAAYLSHQPTILTTPFFVLATMPRWAPQGWRAWRRFDVGYLIRLVGPIAVATGLNSAYNYVRFGTVADVANVYRPNIFNEPWFDRGLFSLSYIPRHLSIVFRDVPRFISTPPYLPVPWTGLAIWVTTPAFVYALRARWNLETAAAWVGIVLVSLVVMSFGATGITQFGYRLATDFYPLLCLLTFRGMGPRPSIWAKGLIALSILVNAWGVIFWRLRWMTP